MQDDDDVVEVPGPLDPQAASRLASAKNDFVVAILAMFPDICPEYMNELGEGVDWDVERGANHLFDRGEPYPTRSTKKRKHEETPPTPTASSVGPEVDYTKDPQRRHDGKTVSELNTYLKHVVALLCHEFPQYYHRDVTNLVKENHNCCYQSFLVLYQKSTGQVQQTLPVKQRINKDRGESVEQVRRHTDRLVNAVVQEFEAAKAACAAEEVKRQKEKEEVANLSLAKYQGNVAECLCCFDELAMNRMVHCNGDEIHWYCKDCARQQAATLIGDGKYELTCFGVLECEAEFARNQKDQFLDEKLSMALDRIEKAAILRIAGLDDLVSCPFCDYAAECPPAEVDKEFRCDNAECAIVSCRLCLKETHIPKSCREVILDNGLEARREIEEAMSSALIRHCKKCRFLVPKIVVYASSLTDTLLAGKSPFIKENGCNKMLCSTPRCGNIQCYICSAIITSYSHFNDIGRGGRAGNCPLWDRDRGMTLEGLHREEVAKAEAISRQKVIGEHPEIDVKLLEINMKA
jgi:E3 ubiquitin-protein ligase RNF216